MALHVDRHPVAGRLTTAAALDARILERHGGRDLRAERRRIGRMSETELSSWELVQRARLGNLLPGENTDKISLLQKAIELDPDNANAHAQAVSDDHLCKVLCHRSSAQAQSQDKQSGCDYPSWAVTICKWPRERAQSKVQKSTKGEND